MALLDLIDRMSCIKCIIIIIGLSSVFFHARMGWTVRACTGWTVPQNIIWHFGIGADVLQPDALPDANPGSTCYPINPGYMGGTLCMQGRSTP